jgi:MFS family permease
MSRSRAHAPVRLGLRENAGQFALLVGVNALVGASLGQERTVVPLLARDAFAVSGATVAVTFVVAFGISKALANLAAGAMADRWGRKPVLIAGWLLALPVPLLVIWAPAWEWIVAANVLLGMSQGLTWSMTVLMKIDLVGQARRGLAMGLNETAGYVAVGVTALATGWIAAGAGLRPAPFFLGIVVCGLGLGASALLVHETRAHVERERTGSPIVGGRRSWRRVFIDTTVRDRSLSAVCQAGLVNNANDALAWGLLPVFWVGAGLSVSEVSILVAAYPVVWGIGQAWTGALSDRIGRKPLIVVGMLVQAAAIAGIALGSGFAAWLAAAITLGVGTAMVYPALLAAVADVAEPSWRGAAVGVYRLWRDLGFAVGALVAGVIADRFGILTAIWFVAVMTATSGGIATIRMQETRFA